MSRIASIVAACAALLCATISAEEATTGASAPATPASGPAAEASAAPAKKPTGEFRAWLVNTSDSTWQARWIASFPEIPAVQQVGSVRQGEHLYTLIFMTNPTLDANDEADVRCDLRVTAPDGSRPVQSTDMDCLRGRLNGDPAKIWLSHHIIEFVGEPADPTGTWRVNVTLRDTLRNQTVSLKTSFELLKGT